MNDIFDKLKNKKSQPIILLISGLVLGLLVITQAKYFTNYVSNVGRDSTENIFRNIQILKTSIDELEEEIVSLETQLEEVSVKSQALASIDKEIQKNELIAGAVDIKGSGIIFEISNDLHDIWFTDIVNELLAAGAEAISINNIRLTDSSIGFDTLPNGQIMINGSILTPPYTFSVIGDGEELEKALNNSVGIIERLKASTDDLVYTLEKTTLIKMKKV